MLKLFSNMYISWTYGIYSKSKFPFIGKKNSDVNLYITLNRAPKSQIIFKRF